MNKALIISVMFLLCIGFAQAVIQESCITVSACVDGSDYLYLNNGELSLSHIGAAVIGDHPECPADYMYKIYIDGVAHTLDYYADSYWIDGKSSLIVDVLNIDYITPIAYRGGISLYNPSTVFLDDDAPGGPAVYSLDICGMPNNTVPEFGFVAMVVALIGGLCVFVFTRKN